MTHWHPTAALVGLPGMPATARPITCHGPKRGWVRRRRRGYEWLESSLPAPAREALAAARAAPAGSTRSLPNERYAALADARLEILAALDRWLDAEQPARLNDGLVTFAERYVAGEIPISPETREAIPQFTHRSLHRWRRDRREGGGTGLMPRYAACATKTSRIDADPELAGRLEAYIYQHPKGSAPFARRWLIARCGADRVPGVRAVRAWMARWKAANASSLLAVTDPDGWRSRYEVAYGDAAAGVVKINQRWELDSTLADMLCTDGRHALVQVFEVYSRRAMVLVTPTSRSTAIAAVLRRALLEWGIPDMAVTDQGKDYVSNHVCRLLADLRIEHKPVAPYRPDLKPFVERFFGTLTRGLFQYLPGYTGPTVAERQAIRNRRSFAERHGEPETFGVALTAAELQERIDAWIEHVYEREPHSGLDGQTPFLAAAGQPVQRIVDERALDLLLAPPPKGGKYRTPGKDGLKVEGGTYLAGELAPFTGYRVELRIDPTDWGVVYAFAGDVIPAHLDYVPGQFIARAVDTRRLGVDARRSRGPREVAREGRGPRWPGGGEATDARVEPRRRHG